VRSDPLLDASKTLRLGRRLALVVTHVNVDECRTRLEGFVRGLDLLGDAERNRRVLRFLRQRTRDCDADDERFAGRG
jgi:hypothetical protein